jgi:hypothetical protein
MPNGTIGRRGEGPGEFELPSDMGWAGDTLWVWDRGSFRLTWFTREGALARDQSVRVDIGSLELATQSIYPPRQETLLPDGTMYGLTPAFSNAVVEGTLTEIAHVRISIGGELLDTLVVLPIGQADVLGIPTEGGGGTYTSQPFGDGVISGLTYDRASFLILDRTAASDPEGRPEYGLTKIDLTGDTVFTRGYRYVPIPIPEAKVDSAVNATAQRLYEFLGDRTGRPLAQWQEDVRSALWLPDHYPPVEAIKPGRDGRIWVQLTTPGSGAATWEVLGESGDPVGRVEAPVGFTLLAAGVDRIWGVERDELDVEYIVRYRLVTP